MTIGDDDGRLLTSITGTGSPLTARHNNLNSLASEHPVLCPAFLLCNVQLIEVVASCCLEERGRIPSQRWPPTNSIREKGLKLTSGCINRIQTRCGPVVIATLDRWSGPKKQFGNPETGLKC